MKHDGTNDSSIIIRRGRGRAKRSRRPHDMIGVALLIIFICSCCCLFLVAMSWLCETVLQHMLSSFLNLNALPVPLLRQVFVVRCFDHHFALLGSLGLSLTLWDALGALFGTSRTLFWYLELIWSSFECLLVSSDPPLPTKSNKNQ